MTSHSIPLAPVDQLFASTTDCLRFGKEGYRRVYSACCETTQYLASAIEKIGPFEISYGGDMNSYIPALGWKISAGADPGFRLYDLADRLPTRGW